jgi:hypothetical protein
MAYKDPVTSKQGLPGKGQHVTWTVSQELGIIRSLESGESWSAIVASYIIGSSTVYDIKKQMDHLQLFLTRSDSV